MRSWPREIVTGRYLDFKKHFKVAFGTYVEAYNEPKVTYNMNPITHKWIALRLTQNMQYTQKYFCTETGRVLKIRKYRPYGSACLSHEKSEWLVQEVKNRAVCTNIRVNQQK